MSCTWTTARTGATTSQRLADPGSGMTEGLPNLASVLEQPDTRRRLADAGFQPHVMPAEEFANFIAAERVKWAKVIKAIGIEPQ